VKWCPPNLSGLKGDRRHVPAPFRAAITRVAQVFGERVKAVPSKDQAKKLNWDTFCDPECGARTKHGRIRYGSGMGSVIDLAYGVA